MGLAQFLILDLCDFGLPDNIDRSSCKDDWRWHQGSGRSRVYSPRATRPADWETTKRGAHQASSATVEAFTITNIMIMLPYS